MHSVSLTIFHKGILLFVYYLPRGLLCHIYYKSEHPPHGETVPCDSPCMGLTLSFDLWPWPGTYIGLQTHYYGSGMWSLFRKTCTPTPLEAQVREKKPGDLMFRGRGMILKHCSSVFWGRPQLLFRSFRCVWSLCWRFSSVTDWWMSEGDIKCLLESGEGAASAPTPQTHSCLQRSLSLTFTENTFMAGNVSALRTAYINGCVAKRCSGR